MDEPNIHKLISEDERELAILSFLMAHPYEQCGEAVQITQGPWSVICHCERCRILRTYEIAD